MSIATKPVRHQDAEFSGNDVKSGRIAMVRTIGSARNALSIQVENHIGGSSVTYLFIEVLRLD